jgi:hypothetical protein
MATEFIEKAAMRAPFSKQTGGTVCNTTNAAALPYGWGADNTAEMRWNNAAGTDVVRALSVNSANQVMVAEALATAERKTVMWSMQDNASISTQAFFIVNTGESYRITGVSWIHTTKSSVAGTAYVEKTPSGTAPGSGTSVMSGTFDMTANNATLLTATLSTTTTGNSDSPSVILAAGDALSIVVAGTITSLAGVTCVVTMAPLGASVKTASFYMKSNTDLVRSETFLVANRPYVVTGVSMRWSTASSVAGLRLTVTNDATTAAAGAGTSVLTDGSNAGPLATTTANTTVSGTLSTTAATVRLLPGNRLAIQFNGASLTALAGLVVTVSMSETAAGRAEKTMYLNHVVGAADLVGWVSGTFFIADRDYEVLDISEIHDVAAGAAAKVAVTAESGTTAAGSGTVLTTQNTNAGFDLNAVARTVQFATLATSANRFLLAGDRLSCKPSGTLTTAAGVAITVSLAPR